MWKLGVTGAISNEWEQGCIAVPRYRATNSTQNIRVKAEDWPLLCWLSNLSSSGLMRGMCSRVEAILNDIAPA